MKNKSRSQPSRWVRLVEVGPRDGLQNEKAVISVGDRLTLIEKLAQAGFRHIEVGAFVSPTWVPQMANSSELIAKLNRQRELRPTSPLAKSVLSALAPNQRGMADAVSSGLKEVAIFASASESFSQKNINCSIEESFSRFSSILKEARSRKMRVRGYLSMCFGCPFEGEIAEAMVVKLAKRLVKLGVYEVSIGDTIGVADPAQVRSLLKKLIPAIGLNKLAMHFHDTRGTALANILASLDLGVRIFDSSIGGLGGCPYAPAATGNVASEDVIYMVHRMGYETGVDLQKAIEVNHWISGIVGRELPSRVGRAGLPLL